MGKIVVTLLTLFLATQIAYAADTGCETKAAEKKLAGAAKNSFIKKCEKDVKVNAAQVNCDIKAAEKKLKGQRRIALPKNVSLTQANNVVIVKPFR